MRRLTAARAEAWLLGGVVGLIRRLGPVRASEAGGALARAVGPLLPVSRVAHANLRRVMPELDRRSRARVVRGVWDNLGRTFAELPHLSSLRRDTPDGPGWVLEGAEHVEALRRETGPVIFVSGHIGNWEMLPVAAAACGYPMASFYRAAKDPVVDALIRALREEAISVHPDPLGFAAFPKGAAGARLALRHLVSGRHLGMLVDQKMNDGITLRFFGRPAMTAPALAAFALRFRCRVLPGRVIRVGPARFVVRCEAAVPLPDTGDEEADRAALMQALNDRLERWIRERPDTWLWLHRRWPRD